MSKASNRGPLDLRDKSHSRINIFGNNSQEWRDSSWIRDISPSGALVTSEDRLPAGCDVILKRGNIFAAGHITRSNDSGAEVAFYRELEERDIASAVQPGPSSAG